ncbi:respiratory nitrate reductase subunit gamma [Microaerobacter geothermalis]|uniref:respiratory nitrate reductase subunit gamma n=1 Tax=Microaerobacter geothermalis TaxID=674972 RepID=UPI001F2312B2|nr:respiratory nitrate reductase subunit gamma [Microaerobacter geothermalis]MCF6092566.1 respiratory nitrate reductase subunit gamma [Microaerobacter geothermalis]
MNWGDQFLWVIYPYVVITIFIVGHIYRFNTDQYGWTSKSSELLEKRILKWGSILFHWGIVFVFFGHIAGLLIPISFYQSLGVSDELYHIIAVGIGGLAGFATAIGVFILLFRRLSMRRIRSTTSMGDMAAIVLVAIAIVTGMLATTTNAVGSSEFDYRTTIGPWIRGVFTLQPDASFMAEVPQPFKIHVISALSLFAVWPFTRLVHVFSLPITYLWRSYVIYRRRNPRVITSKQR